jgi:5-methylcytosine-specific restriction protein A
VQKIDPTKLTQKVSKGIGYELVSRNGVDKGEQWIDLIPKGLTEASSFKIRVILGWRHFEVLFKPGAFSGKLLLAMRHSTPEIRGLFISVIRQAVVDCASVKLKISGKQFDVDDDSLWNADWENVTFRFRVSRFDLDEEEYVGDKLEDYISSWSARMAASVLILMPIDNESADQLIESFPEGSSRTIQVNRYERDSRNRAASLAIHGCKCLACDLQMSDIYGDIAEGYIEVHHTVPLSSLGKNYQVDPRNDLIPLCPNCHSIAHRRKPPLSLDEIRLLLSAAASSPDESPMSPNSVESGVRVE